MPHTPSAKKSLRQDAKRREHNRTIKKALKVQIKKYLVALKSGTVEQAQNEYNVTVGKIDKAGVKGIMHLNTASRRKSLMARWLLVKKSSPAPMAATK